MFMYVLSVYVISLLHSTVGSAPLVSGGHEIDGAAIRDHNTVIETHSITKLILQQFVGAEGGTVDTVVRAHHTCM